MREIKFRGWNGSEFYNPIIAEGQVFRSGRDFEDWNTASQDPLMQYVGLKDKNGVEIYEGDVIDYGFNRFAAIVFWEGRFTFKGLNFSDGNPSAIVDFFRYQVIGNIHENPELLEVKQ